MPSLPKTLRRETTKEQRSAVWTWHLAGKTYSQIARLEDLLKPTIAGIIQRAKQASNESRFSNKKQTGAPKKITSQAEQRLLC